MPTREQLEMVANIKIAEIQAHLPLVQNDLRCERFISLQLDARKIATWADQIANAARRLALLQTEGDDKQ